jgi:hypothetical protein
MQANAQLGVMKLVGKNTKDYKLGFGGLSDRGIYRWSRLRYSISIVRYDDKMNFVAESKLADGAYCYSPFPPRLILGDKLWVVYGEPGTKYNMGNIQATEIDINTLKLLGTKMIASEEEIGIKNTNPGYDDFDIRFRNSPDNKYCLPLYF